MTTKRCHRCTRVLPVEAFHRQSRSKDGRQAACKQCQRELFRARRKANPERYNAAQRASASRRGHRQESDRTKRLARKKLAYALSRGHIARPDRCDQCGRECKPHGHHHDHSKPLEVEWLCPACHKQAHNEETRNGC